MPPRVPASLAAMPAGGEGPPGGGGQARVGAVCPQGSRVAAGMLVQRLGDPSDFDPLLDRVRAARIVMIGEATHGSYDYYRLRE